MSTGRSSLLFCVGRGAHHRQAKHSLTAGGYDVLDFEFPRSFEDVVGRNDVVLERNLIRYSTGSRHGSQVYYGQFRAIKCVAVDNSSVLTSFSRRCERMCSPIINAHERF